MVLSSAALWPVIFILVYLDRVLIMKNLVSALSEISFDVVCLALFWISWKQYHISLSEWEYCSTGQEEASERFPSILKRSLEIMVIFLHIAYLQNTVPKKGYFRNDIDTESTVSGCHILYFITILCFGLSQIQYDMIILCYHFFSFQRSASIFFSNWQKKDPPACSELELLPFLPQISTLLIQTVYLS